MKFVFLLLFDLLSHITKVHVKRHVLPSAQLSLPKNILVECSAVTFRHPSLDLISPALRRRLEFQICGTHWLVKVHGLHALRCQRIPLQPNLMVPYTTHRGKVLDPDIMNCNKAVSFIAVGGLKMLSEMNRFTSNRP